MDFIDATTAKPSFENQNDKLRYLEALRLFCFINGRAMFCRGLAVRYLLLRKLDSCIVVSTYSRFGCSDVFFQLFDLPG